jgi:hypothetical protein
MVANPYGKHFTKILRDAAAVIEAEATKLYAAFGHDRAGYSALRKYAQYCRLARELRRIAAVRL